MSTRVVAHAYPWDVVGDPSFTDRAGRAGICEISLAASYHSTRAATPHHPAHRFVDAASAALYRPVRPVAWRGRALAPSPAEWVPGPDPFGDAVATLTAAGMRVNAWVVLAHSTRLGTRRPDLTVRNCFGESYRYALCPTYAEVQDYCRTLAHEAILDTAVDGVSLEGCGQLGAAHHGLHEKTDGAYSATAGRLLSICCCTGCQKRWVDRGLETEDVCDRLRRALTDVESGRAQRATMADLLGADRAEALLAARLESQDELRTQVVEVVRATAPGARITLHGQPDPWATGPSPAVTARAAADVDAVLVPAWAPGEASEGAIARMRQVAGADTRVAAYLTVLPPISLDEVRAHADRIVDSGADELHLYHLGLANRSQLAELGRVAAHAARR